MKKIRYILISIVLTMAVIISGCDLTSLDQDAAERLAEKAEEIQPLLSVLSAAQSIYEPADATTLSIVSRTLNSSGNSGAEWVGKKPSDICTSSSAVVRVPASGLLENLNGSSGDDYYFTLGYYGDDPSTSTPGLYKVTLYTYPTTSASVHYVLEEYLVSDDTGWPIVDASGVFDATALIRYETHYYDGGVDYRTIIVANVEAPGDHYPLDALYNPTTDEEPQTATAAYTYPASDPTSVVTTSNNDYAYSALVSGSGPVDGLSFYEYYAESSDQKDRRAVSFLYTDYASLYISGNEETVRRYQYDVTEMEKTVRSKTVNTMTLSGTDVVKTSYEYVDIDLTENAGVYDSTVVQVKTSGTTTTVISLEEGATSGSYSGTVTVTAADGTETKYTATLTTDDGLILTDAEGNTVIDSYMPIVLEDGQQLITIELPDGGTIEGILTRGILNGIIRSGRVADIIIGPNYVQVIYDTNRGRTRATR